ncbi:MAG: signal recognition particle-docking protein FtsY [Candidatus Aegiribacteria sp.]|nr:signal recognition particle-docking protein FtsY [Candidatus Aegiribacteria sp.]
MNLSNKLRRSREALAGRLSQLFSSGCIDEGVLEDAEEILLGSDLGWELTEKIMLELPGRIKKSGQGWKEALAGILRESVPVRSTSRIIDARPSVIIVVGVNGAGKTTTIARLAAKLQKKKSRVLLACADTFRAAAAEQLEIWAEKLGTAIITQLPGSDPGAVAYDAVKRGLSRDYDTVIIDTAGRLPNKKGLLAELSKIHRVCGKAMESAPHEVLLVLDATVGQNARAQAEQFLEAIPVTGLVITKLDGTAKGGSVLAMASQMDIPVKYIGVGESSDDLLEFELDSFINALLDIEDGKF